MQGEHRSSKFVSTTDGVFSPSLPGGATEDRLANRQLIPSAINANDCVRKFKFNRVYGYHHSLNDNIMRTTDVMSGRRRALVCRFCDVSECCSSDLRDFSARVLIADCDPICGDS